MSYWKPVDRIQNKLVNKLGGEERIKRIESGELVLVERSALAVSNSSENGGISPYVSNVMNPEAFIADWREFYRQVHSIKADPSGLIKRLPPVTPGFNWGVGCSRGRLPREHTRCAKRCFLAGSGAAIVAWMRSLISPRKSVLPKRCSTSIGVKPESKPTMN